MSTARRANVFCLWVYDDDRSIGEWTKLIYRLRFWLIFHLFIYTSTYPLWKGRLLLIGLRLYILVVRAFWLFGRIMAFLPCDFYYPSIFRDIEILVLLSFFIFYFLFLCHNTFNLPFKSQMLKGLSLFSTSHLEE